MFNFYYNCYICVKYSLIYVYQFNPEYMLWEFVPNLKNALYEGFVGIFLGKSAVYNIALWTIKYEIKGLILIVAILALFGSYNKRYIIYLLGIIFYKNTYFMPFVLGLILSDLKVNKAEILDYINKSIINLSLLIIGLMLSMYPIMFTKNEKIYQLMQELCNYNGIAYRIIGATIIFLVVINDKKVQQILSCKFFVKIGEISFSIYTIHLIIMGTFSGYIGLYLNKFLSYNVAAIISIVISSGVIYIISKLIYKYIDLNGIKLSNYIYLKYFK